MASISARRFLQRSSSVTRAYLGRNQRPATSPSVGSASSNLGGVSSSNPPSAARFSRPKYPSCSSRLPVELASALSMMPLHSATASALLNSMLSSKVGSWGWLSEVYSWSLLDDFRNDPVEKHDRHKISCVTWSLVQNFEMWALLEEEFSCSKLLDPFNQENASIEIDAQQDVREEGHCSQQSSRVESILPNQDLPPHYSKACKLFNIIQ